MRNPIIITIGLLLFTLVLIGVTLIESISTTYIWIQPLVPMIVITGFFTFLLSVAFFLYGIINIFKKK